MWRNPGSAQGRRIPRRWSAFSCQSPGAAGSWTPPAGAGSWRISRPAPRSRSVSAGSSGAQKGRLQAPPPAAAWSGSGRAGRYGAAPPRRTECRSRQRQQAVQTDGFRSWMSSFKMRGQILFYFTVIRDLLQATGGKQDGLCSSEKWSENAAPGIQMRFSHLRSTVFIPVSGRIFTFQTVQFLRYRRKRAQGRGCRWWRDIRHI